MVICDTSGRLHTNYKLMEELVKSFQVIQKKGRKVTSEVLLVLDGTTGVAALACRKSQPSFRRMLMVARLHFNIGGLAAAKGLFWIISCFQLFKTAHTLQSSCH